MRTDYATSREAFRSGMPIEFARVVRRGQEDDLARRSSGSGAASARSVGGRSVHYHDAWAVAGQGPGFTWNIGNPNARPEMDAIVRQPHHRRRIDYVFVGSWYAHPNAHCYINSAELAFDQPLGGIWASDHYGVVVDLDVGMEPSPG